MGQKRKCSLGRERKERPVPNVDGGAFYLGMID